jgi:hypothetical protein
VEIKPQHVVKEQLQSSFASRPMEEEELQQLIVEEQPEPIPPSKPMEDKELQQLVFVSNIILKCPR